MNPLYEWLEVLWLLSQKIIMFYPHRIAEYRNRSFFLGNVRTTTLKAFNEAEMKKIVEKIP